MTEEQLNALCLQMGNAITNLLSEFEKAGVPKEIILVASIGVTASWAKAIDMKLPNVLEAVKSTWRDMEKQDGEE